MKFYEYVRKMAYGFDRIEMHKDAINENDVVLVHDDLLATGGTSSAACDMVKQFNPKKVMANFIIELTNFQSRQRFPEDVEIFSLVEMDELDGCE